MTKGSGRVLAVHEPLLVSPANLGDADNEDASRVHTTRYAHVSRPRVRYAARVVAGRALPATGVYGVYPRPNWLAPVPSHIRP
jgi:hypothetical protein